jgi:hypothetical protein
MGVPETLVHDVLKALHTMMEGCQCDKSDCPECNAVCSALLELERVPAWLAVSDSIEASMLGAEVPVLQQGVSP